jgi:hypothetical protein
LPWSIDKFLPNLFCKLKYSDKVAYTETKAHRDLLLHNIESQIAKNAVALSRQGYCGGAFDLHDRFSMNMSDLHAKAPASHQPQKPHDRG